MRVSRIRPYLLTAVAVMPILAGMWIWTHLPTQPSGAVPAGPAVQVNVSAPMIRAAQVVADEGGALAVLVDVNASVDTPIGTRFQWYQNGQPIVGQTAAVLPHGVVKQGDQVMAQVTPNNGTIDGAIVSTPLYVVGNAAPAILKLQFAPPAPTSGEDIEILAEVTDVDRHDVTLSYRWYKNGTLIQDGYAYRLQAREVIRGDRVAVEVIPYDGQAEGVPVRSEEVMIGNSVPKITSQPIFTAQGARLMYRVIAGDLDRDALVFTLAASPAGMTIEKDAGLLAWTPEPGAQGPQRVRIEVSDGHQGLAVQEFDVTVPTAAGDSTSSTPSIP